MGETCAHADCFLPFAPPEYVQEEGGGGRLLPSSKPYFGYAR